MPSLPSENLLNKLRESAKYSQREEVRSKIHLFLKAIQLGNILKACREFRKATSFYYYWWNRYRDAGFKIEALEEKSRRPKRFPRQIDPKVVEWIKNYREQFHYGPEKIRLYLEKDQGIRVSKATVYRVLLREKIPFRKRKGHRGALIQTLAGKLDELWAQSKASPTREQIQSLLQSILPSLEKPYSLLPSRPKKQGPSVPLQETVADRYLLEKELGRGGAGTVYLAQDLRSKKKKVALKRILLEKQEDPSFLSILKTEFNTLTSLNHHHLAKVFDFGATDREIYFTSEFIDGEDILKTASKIHLNTIFQLIVQSLRALDFLHRRGVLHLDIKPENILVTDPNKTGDLSVKLIDFGTSEWRKKGQISHGEFVGTPPYAPPEIIQERSPTPASDIYSLGMILHQIFAGRFPFQNKDPVKIMKEQIYGEPLRMDAIHPALPKDFSDLLRKTVARNPEDRFQSPREVLQAINQCLGENFSLRPQGAPLRLLEESDFLLRKELFEEILNLLSGKAPQVIVLSGPLGIGKSRLMQQIKWTLQLRGVSPRSFEEAQELEEFLKENPVRSPSPLLIDLKDASGMDFVNLLDRLENQKAPVLITTTHPRNLEMNPSRWIDLEPLRQETIVEFLRSEIAEFPAETYGEEITRFSCGIPSQLETLLQAMREEGWIQWTDLGWRWMEKEKTDLSSLIPRHEARWREYREKILDVLKFSRVGINAETLAGILNLETQALEEKLTEWEKEGFMVSKRAKKAAYYSPKTSQAETSLAPILPNWPWMKNELETLYEKAEFSAGMQWADLVFSKGTPLKEIPVKITLLCARHYAAGGAAEKALRILPSSPPDDPTSNGLSLEIRGRALFILGNLEGAQEALQEAERSYDFAKDKRGLSRVFNLKGILFKIRGEPAESSEWLLRSIKTAEEASDFYHLGMARMNLATLYHDQGDYTRADRVYREIFSLEKKEERPLLACKLRHNWVNLLFHMGQVTEAEKTCYEWLRLSLKYRYADQQAAALNYLALLAGRRDHREIQLIYLNQALSLLNPAQFPQLYFQILLNRGYLYLDLRRFTAAQLDAEAAVNWAERHAGQELSHLAYLLLGKILRDRPCPDSEEAGRYLNTAHQIIWKKQIRQLLWEIEFERGLLAKKKKEIERAKNYFRAAQEHLDSFLQTLPEVTRQSYLRDRRWERIADELESL